MPRNYSGIIPTFWTLVTGIPRSLGNWAFLLLYMKHEGGREVWFGCSMQARSLA